MSDTAAALTGFEVARDWSAPSPGPARDVPGVAVDADDHVYLIARGAHPPITELTPDGTLVRTFGDELAGRPHGITVGPDLSVYAVCDSSHTVTKFAADGTLAWTLGTPGTPAPGWSGKPFHRPTDVAVAPDNSLLFVTDGYGNGRVHVFTPDGEHVRSWGKPGGSVGEMILPHGVATDGERVFVADREAHSILVFDTAGVLHDTWRTFLPSGVTLAKDGRVFVAEFNARAIFRADFPTLDDRVGFGRRIVVLTADGERIETFGGGGPDGPPTFIAPHSLAVDSRGDVYVGEVSMNVYERVSGGLTAPADLSCVHKLRARSSTDEVAA